MAQRRHHYELAFEHYLRERRVPYLAVDEARKALLPGGAPPAAGGPALKSFDFVLYGAGANLLVEVKGRRIAPRPRRDGRPAPAGRLESWVTEDDVGSLRTWERLFGEGFSAAFVFLYWCDASPSRPLFEETFEFRGRWYAVRALTVEAYARAMRPRSPRWRTVHLSTADFDRLSTALCAPGDALHRPAAAVASPA
jgi:hypothetical protein